MSIHGKDEGLFLQAANEGISCLLGCLVLVVGGFISLMVLGLVINALGW